MSQPGYPDDLASDLFWAGMSKSQKERDESDSQNDKPKEDGE